jgi:hypothetical protein
MQLARRFINIDFKSMRQCDIHDHIVPDCFKDLNSYPFFNAFKSLQIKPRLYDES